jgi:1-acyl-sn-glycerol-3-phosphate acyltransferase
VGNQSQKRSLPERLNEAYASEEQMVIFPAGLCARRIKGEVCELPGQSPLYKKHEFKRDVVRYGFEGKNSNFFTTSPIFARPGYQTNIEMLYLADELFKQKSKVFHIIYGKPIPGNFSTRQDSPGMASWVREQAIGIIKI